MVSDLILLYYGYYHILEVLILAKYSILSAYGSVSVSKHIPDVIHITYGKWMTHSQTTTMQMTDGPY